VAVAAAIGLRLLLDPWLGGRLLGGAMRKVAARARASDERFRKFMENSPAGVSIKDAEGRTVFMNAAAEVVDTMPVGVVRCSRDMKYMSSGC